MKNFIDRLKSGETLICDGGMGTSLQVAGLETGKVPEEWNISNPGAVLNVHKSFIDAGSDMIITNTFGANLIKLNRAGLQDKFLEINIAAVALAKEAAGNSAYVLGDIGPTGDFLRPLGVYEYQDFYDAFFKQAVILCKGGIDGFIIETMSSLDELKAAISACRAAAGLPVIANMTFMAGEKGYRTMMGISIDQAVNEMLAEKCSVVGANCGCGSQQMVEIMKQMKDMLKKRAAKNIFLIAQPNAGMPKLVNNKTVFTESTADFTKAVKELVKLRVNIIGGCCGTTPEHIKEIVRIVKGR